MRITIITIVTVVFVVGVCNVHAESIVFTESGQILDGEIWDFVEIYNDDTVVDMFGGFADYITTYDASTLNVTGGHADFGAVEYSTINISGGTFSGVQTHDYSTINFSDNGSGNYLLAEDFGTINMTGGYIEAIIGREDGIANLFYGSISEYIAAHDSSTINIFGYDLYKADSGGAYGNGVVYGLWTDSTPFNIALRDDEFGPTFPNIYLHEIPEPGTCVLLGLGVLILRKKWLV